MIRPSIGLQASTPQRVAYWAQKAREASEHRDRWIVEASGEGYSLRAIGDAAGLTHAGVARVLKRAPS